MASYRRRVDTTDTHVVRLTRKLADAIDGVDLTEYDVGDVITVPARSARLLLLEGWAEPIDEERVRGPKQELAVAADRPRSPRR
jgi:hypothetical protein